MSAVVEDATAAAEKPAAEKPVEDADKPGPDASNEEKIAYLRKKLPKHLAKPDRNVYDRGLQSLQSEVTTLQKKRSALYAEAKMKRQGGGAIKDEREAARKQMRTLVKEKDRIKDERRALLDQQKLIKEQQDKLREQSKAMKDELGRFTDMASIDRKIRELEMEQQTGNLTLPQEKDLVKRIEQLHRMRGEVLKFVNHSNGTKKSTESTKELSAQISELSVQLKEAGSKILEQKNVLIAIDAKAGNREDQIAPLIAEAEKANAVIEEKMAEIRSKRQAWKKDNDEYYTYMLKVREIRTELRALEDIEYQKRREEERIAYEAEVAKQKPWLEEIALCDQLTSYLKRLIPQEESTAASTEESNTQPDTITLADGTVVKAMKRKETSSYGTSTKKGKKKRKKKKKAGNRDLTHAMNVLQDFKYLSDHSKRDISPPSNIGQIAGILTSLKEIRDYYDTLPRAKKVAPTLAKGSEVSTQYGKGKVVETRSDGIVVAKLEWGTAYIREP